MSSDHAPPIVPNLPPNPKPNSTMPLFFLRLTSPRSFLPFPFSSIPSFLSFLSNGEDPDPSPPLADEIFRSVSRSGNYTQGDATYLSLARSLSDPADIHRLLARMRRDSRPFPERIFFPIFRAFGRANLPGDALHLFDEMIPCFRCAPTVRSLNSALSALLSSPSGPSLALPFYSRAVRSHPSSISPNLLTSNLLLKALCRCELQSSLDEAIHLFRSLPCRDVYSYSTLIDALSRQERLDEALALLDEMQLDGVPPTSVTFNSLLHAMCRAGDLTRAAKLTRYMLLKGCAPTVATYNTLIHGLCLQGKLDAAVSLLDRMVRDGCKPNQVTYGAIVDGLVKHGRAADADRVVKEMAAAGVPPNEFIFSALITGFFRSGDPDGATEKWTLMIEAGVRPNTVLYTAFIDGLCRHGRTDEAEQVFAKMTAEHCTANVFTYSSLVRGHFKAGNGQRALAAWKEMLASGCEPNAVSYSILIHGLCEEGRLREGMMVWKNMLARGCTADVVAYTSMIRGFCGAGLLDFAMALFNDMLARADIEPDVVTYNTLFDGLLKGGKLTRAMDLLGGMLHRGRCDPDEVTCNTFLRVLGGEEGKARGFMDGLAVRLCRRGRVGGAAAVVGVMMGKCLTPETATWLDVVSCVCRPRRVRKAIEKCWSEIKNK